MELEFDPVSAIDKNASSDARKELCEAFRRCGIRSGVPLLIHSSLSAFGPVPGGPTTVIDALLDVLGPKGTLCVPTLSYLFTTEATPIFDVRSTPTNLGSIPAAFLKREAVVRSVHPTHSVAALGPDALAIVGDHHLDRTPVGPNSPFTKVKELGGQVAFLGCGMRCNTSIHGVEETLAAMPHYLLLPTTIVYTVTDNEGHTEAVEHRRHNFANTVQRYEKMADLLASVEGAYSTGKALNALVHVMDSQAMWVAARTALDADPTSLTAEVEAGNEEAHRLVAGSGEGVWKYNVVVGPNNAHPDENLILTRI